MQKDSYNKDPIEETKEYKLAMEKIQPILDEEFPKDEFMFGSCHSYWRRKKELLEQLGVKWSTPDDLNPDIIFD